MKPLNLTFISLLMLLSVTSAALADDFDWFRDFNIMAEADPSGFRARLEARFHVGDLEIKTVLGNVEKPSEAYMVFRLGEMSNQPVDQVLNQYKTNRSKGWGVLARNLGIKPGSKDFHDLKQGQDLYETRSNGRGKSKNKGKGHRGRS